MNLNKVIIAGHLTRSPEVRFFGDDASGKAVCNFGLAVNERYKGKDGEKKETTTFIDVECWGRTAELVGQYLTKGRGAYIEGRLKLDQWDDKESGQKRSKLKVVADNVQFLGGKGSGDGSEADAPAKREPAPIKPQAGHSLDELDSPPF